MDLSDYALGFILIMIFDIAFLMLVAKKIEKPASVIFIVALIGVFIGSWICDLFEFSDASLETLITLILSSVLPPCIIVCRWSFLFLKERNVRKINILKLSIVEEYEAMKRELYTEKEFLEEKMLINKGIHNLMVLLQLCVITNLEFFELQEIQIQEEQRRILLKDIKEIEKEIKAIDNLINEVEFNNRYSQLLRIKRGGMK